MVVAFYREQDRALLVGGLNHGGDICRRNWFIGETAAVRVSAFGLLIQSSDRHPAAPRLADQYPREQVRLHRVRPALDGRVVTGGGHRRPSVEQRAPATNRHLTASWIQHPQLPRPIGVDLQRVG
jgi:hypothetical protein